MVTKSFKDLEVWQEAMVLVTEVYRASESFPKSQLYSLTQQIQKSAVSVPSNLSEGQGRRKDTEFHYFARVSRGSLCELETQLLLAQRLGYLSEQQMSQLNDRIHCVGRLLNGLLRFLEKETGDVPAAT